MHSDDSWNVSEEGFPAQGGPEEKLRFLLSYAVLAPSGHNTQPWLFRLSGDKAELYADRTRGLPVVDPEDCALTISCGAALFYLRTALRHFGYAGEVETFPDPDETDLLARVCSGAEQEATEEEQRLFRAIPNRHSTASLRGSAGSGTAALRAPRRRVGGGCLAAPRRGGGNETQDSRADLEGRPHPARRQTV